jgi:hypothetical protein
MSLLFNIITSGKAVLETPLQEWNDSCSKKLGRIKAAEPKKKVLETAQSIASQSLESLKKGHAYVWAAERGGKIHAALIADQKGSHLIIRFLVANILDEEAKGAGTFLAKKFLEEAKKVSTLVRLTPENATKYWKNKIGFKEYPEDPTQLFFTF